MPLGSKHFTPKQGNLGMALTRAVIISLLIVFGYGAANAQGVGPTWPGWKESDFALPHPRDPKDQKYNYACDGVTADLISGSDDRPTLLSDIANCNRHPTKIICEEASKTIRLLRETSPLTCGAATSEDDATAIAKAKDALATFQRSSTPGSAQREPTRKP
jgi:hypothetical protein